MVRCAFHHSFCLSNSLHEVHRNGEGFQVASQTVFQLKTRRNRCHLEASFHSALWSAGGEIFSTTNANHAIAILRNIQHIAKFFSLFLAASELEVPGNRANAVPVN